MLLTEIEQEELRKALYYYFNVLKIEKLHDLSEEQQLLAYQADRKIYRNILTSIFNNCRYELTAVQSINY